VRTFKNLRCGINALTPLSLLILYKLSLQIVGLKMSSLPTLALKYPMKILCGILGIYRTHIPVLH
jgi:hypothetical protein